MPLSAPTRSITVLTETAGPGAGLETTTTSCFPFCAAVAVPVAVSRVDETNVVGAAIPPIETTDPATNPLPFTVIVNGPTATRAGSVEATVG